MLSAEWCAWCNKVLRGKKSFFYGLCSQCRNSKEGREYDFNYNFEELNIRKKIE